MKQTGLARQLASLNLTLLRQTQLAPHIEAKMIAGRFMEMQCQKRTAPSIVLVLNDGHITKVYAPNPFTSVLLAEYGQSELLDQRLEERDEAEEMVVTGGMHLIWHD